jgi:hypothetical protein
MADAMDGVASRTDRQQHHVTVPTYPPQAPPKRAESFTKKGGLLSRSAFAIMT